MSKKVIFCNCGSKIITADRLAGISEFLKQSGNSFVEIADLCGCVVDRKNETQELFSRSTEILVVACYPRAVHLLLQNCGLEPEKLDINYLNFRELNDTQIFGSVNSFFSGETDKTQSLELNNPTDWPSWYPMIDYARCTACGQCSDFCLFGVYEKRDNKVVVINPKGCKNNCPACGRICPQTAIVFPKYEHDGAIAGSETIDEMAEQQRQTQDIETILGSNIYKALEMRKAKRQSIIRSTAMQNAIAERDKALADRKEK